VKRPEILSKQRILENHKVKSLQFCEHYYVYGKQHMTKFPKIVNTTKATLDCVHSDCRGPSRVPSL